VPDFQTVLEGDHRHLFIGIRNFYRDLDKSGEELVKGLRVALTDAEQACGGHLYMFNLGELVDEVLIEINVSCYGVIW
jgi:hypothetical protein